MKRRVLIIFIAILGSTSLFAQKNESASIHKHEFRLGVGAFPLTLRNEYGYGPFDNHYNGGMGGYDFSSLENYLGARYTTGAISLGYTYSFSRWLSLGGTISYTGEFQNTYDRISDRMTGGRTWSDISLTPMVRFTYLNRKYVRLYSQLGVGLQISIERGKTDDGVRNKVLAHITGHATFFGVSVGNRVFGFGELLGVGSQGVFVIGIGYKF